MERCKDSATGLTTDSNQSAVCRVLELDRRHGLCPCVRFWGRVRFLSLACTCIGHVACVLCARVCRTITPGVPHTNPLRVAVGPPLPIVYGCINHKPRRPHTYIQHAHGRLITHTLAVHVMSSVIGGGYHCMCAHYTPCPFSLFLHPNPHCLPRRTDWMFALRSSFDHSKVQTNNCIPVTHFGFACACGTGVSVVRAAPGVRAGVADGCVRHGAGRQKSIPYMRATQVVRAGVADVCVRHWA